MYLTFKGIIKLSNSCLLLLSLGSPFPFFLVQHSVFCGTPLLYLSPCVQGGADPTSLAQWVGSGYTGQLMSVMFQPRTTAAIIEMELLDVWSG